MKTWIMAIDGVAASGKSSVARALAEKFNFEALESGSFYRYVTFAMLERGLPIQEQAVTRTLPDLPFHYHRGHHYFRGQELDLELRQGRVEDQVSFIAQIPTVRDHVNAFLRAYVQGKRVIVEGRDIGTVVFPEAPCKIFLVADPAVRNLRRREQCCALGLDEPSAVVQSNLALRDQIDSTRQVAPLTAAEDALILDTTALSLDETVARAAAFLREKLREEIS